MFLTLMAAGFGPHHDDIANRLTWRQIRHFSAVLARQKRLDQADTIQAIALAVGAKDLKQVLKDLRN